MKVQRRAQLHIHGLLAFGVCTVIIVSYYTTLGLYFVSVAQKDLQ